MIIKYEEGWNLEKFMEENGGFDDDLIIDYLQCTELSYYQEDIVYLENMGVSDIKPYIFETMETEDW